MIKDKLVSLLLSVVMVVTTFAGVMPTTTLAAEPEAPAEEYVVQLNDKECGTTPVEVSYGEPISLKLKDVLDNGTIRFYYSQYPNFLDESDNTVFIDVETNSSEFTKSLDIGTTYYLAYQATIAGENIFDDDGNHRFVIVPATMSSAGNVKLNHTDKTNNFIANWSAVTTATNLSDLDSGAIAGYKLQLFKNGSAVILDQETQAIAITVGAELVEYDFSSVIVDNGYGEYRYSIQPIVAEGFTDRYKPSSIAMSNIITYGDEYPPVITTNPAFDADKQTLYFEGKDNETGIKAYAISKDGNLSKDSSEWVNVVGSEPGVVVTSEKIKKYLSSTTAAGKYYFYLKDKNDNITVSAQTITINKVVYEYDANGSGTKTTIQFYVGDSYSLKTPNRSGYTFVNWYKDENFEEVADPIISSNSLENNQITVYGKWEFDKINISGQPNGGDDFTATYSGTDQTIVTTITNTAGTITWQWQKEVNGEWQNVPGQTTNKLKVRNVADSGRYRVYIKNEIGTDSSEKYSNAINVTINPATLKVIADDKEIEYSDSKPPFSYSLDGLVGNDTQENINITEGTITCPAWDNATVALTKGTYDIVISGFLVENYNVTPVNGTLTVSSKDVTATDSNVTVELLETDFTYAETIVDGNKVPVSYTPAFKVYNNGTEVPSDEYSFEYFNNSKAGRAQLVVSFKNDGNYKGSLTEEFIIKKSGIDVTVSMNGWLYGDVANMCTPTINVDDVEGTVTYHYLDSGKRDIGTDRPVNAGIYYVYVVIAESDNFKEVSTKDNPTKFEIRKRTLHVIAGSDEWQYDGNAHVLDSYTIDPDCDGFANDSEHFQSVIITGSITEKGEAENKIQCNLPDDIKDNYIVTVENGKLVVTETELQVPGGITWSEDYRKAGIAEWVPVIKKNVTVTYKLQLYRRNNDGTFTPIGEPVTTGDSEWDFRKAIYDDSTSLYSDGVTSSVSYAFSVQALPTSGDAKGNYTLSKLSDYESMARVGTAWVVVTGGTGVTNNYAERSFSFDDSISCDGFPVIQGERIYTWAHSDAAYTFAGARWTVAPTGVVSTGSGSYGMSDYGYNYIYVADKIADGSNVVNTVKVTPADKSPDINKFSGELSDALDKVTLTIKASDGLGITGWMLIKNPNVKKDLKPATNDSRWKNDGIAADGLSLSTTVEVTDNGSYYLYIKDSGGNVVGGWSHDDAELYDVINIYKISFESGAAGASGSMDYILKLDDEDVSIPTVGFTYPGFTFKNWKTANSSILEANATYVLNQNDTLTATWTSEQYSYKVCYHYQEIDEDGNLVYLTDEEIIAAGKELDTQSFKAGYNEVINPGIAAYASILKAKEGYSLDAEKTGTITITKNGMVFDIYYKRNTYTVSYSYTDVQGDKVDLGTQQYYFGQKVTALSKPSEVAGFKFIGWSAGDLGQMPETMPAQDINATGYYSAQNVTYKIVSLYETLEDGVYYKPNASDVEERNAIQGEVINFTTGSIFGTVGFNNYRVVAVKASDNPMNYTSIPAGAGTSVNAVADASDEVYFLVFKKREVHKITLNVWKGDTVTGKKLYTKSWEFKTGQPISAEMAQQMENFGKGADWEAGATANGVDLDGYIVADYVNWSTETRPTSMPAGDVVITREYVLATLLPYNIEIYLENENGGYDLGGSLVYYGFAGSFVTIGDGSEYTVDYNSLSGSIASFVYYQYIAHDEQLLSGYVLDTGDPLKLKVYFERKSYKVTVRYYDGISKIFKTETEYRKWGTKYTFDPDKYFDYIAGTYEEDADGSNKDNSFRYKNYVVSYSTYYWDTNLSNYGNTQGHYSTKRLTDIDMLEADYTVTVGMNDGTYAYLYYTVPELEKQYCYDIYYNTTNLVKAPNQSYRLSIADALGDTYNIRVANKRYLYNIVLPGQEDEDDPYADRYPGATLQNGEYTYSSLKEGYELKTFVYKGVTYTFPTKDGFLYIPNTSNQFYEGNRISFNYLTGSGSSAEIAQGGYSLAYSMIEDYLAQYRIDHADESDDPDPKGASTAYIYNPGSSHLCENYEEGHSYTFTFYYNNAVTLTYKLGANACSAHAHMYGDSVTVGCQHSGVFPERKGYEIVWYKDALFNEKATDFVIKGNTVLYGQYEKKVVLSNEYLVFPLAEPITVGGVTYGVKLTEANLLAMMEANDPKYVITLEEKPVDITVTDPQTSNSHVEHCEDKIYYINGVPAIMDRIRPSYCFSDIEMVVDNVENPTYNTMQEYAPEGFRFDDTNVDNKLKGYVQYDGISLYAYFIRENYVAETDYAINENDNLIRHLLDYGTVVTLPILGAGTDNEKYGYEFAGWKIYKLVDDEYVVDVNTPVVYENGKYTYTMPYYDILAVAQWTPAEYTQKIYHYFQNEKKNYLTSLVASLEQLSEQQAGEDVTVVFKGTEFEGKAYKNGDEVIGLSILSAGGIVYFVNGTVDEDGRFVVTEANLAAAVVECDLDAEGEYTVMGFISELSSGDIFGFNYLQFERNSETEIYALGDSITVYPDATISYFYDRSSNYRVDAFAIATDGKNTDTTITGTGDCFFGQEVVLEAVTAEGYEFKGWFDYSTIYNGDGSFTSAYLDYVENDCTGLTPLGTSKTYPITVNGQHKLVAVVRAKTVEMPSIVINGKTEYVYAGYKQSAANSLMVGVDLSDVDPATYVAGYQWMVKKPGADTATPIENANVFTHNIQANLDAGEYEYSCVVTIGRKDNGRTIQAVVKKTVTISTADLDIAPGHNSYDYDSFSHGYFMRYNSISSTDADNYGLVYYYSDKELTLDNYLEMYASGNASYATSYWNYYYDETYHHSDVNVDAAGNVIPYHNYVVVVDPKGNYNPIVVDNTLTIIPITLTLKSTTSAFSKVYDGTTNVYGSVTEVGSQKWTISKGTYYTISGILTGEVETSMLDFDAEFNSAHVKDASAVYLTNIKVVYADGHVNYNYDFEDNYKLNISANITPFTLEAEWDVNPEEQEIVFVYNGQLQYPTAHLVLPDGVTPPDGTDFTLSYTGKQKNVGTGYESQVYVEDKEGAYNSSDYAFTTAPCPFKIVKRKILVTPVTGEFTYNKTNHYLDDVTVTTYVGNGDEVIVVEEGDKSGLAAGQTISFAIKKGYMHAGTYTDLKASDIVIKETVMENDSEVVRNATGNYDIVLGDGTMIIDRKVITLSGITAKDKIYDGNDDAELVFVDGSGNSKITFVGLIEGDSLTFNASNIYGKFNNANVGNNKDVTIYFNDGVLGGASVDDYELDITPLTTKASITTKGLKVVADSLTVTYGETIPFSFTTSGFGEDDANRTVGGTAIYKLYTWDETHTNKIYLDDITKPNVGTYYIEIDPSLLTNSNYTIAWDSEAEQILTVERRKLAVAPVESDTLVISKDYDGNTEAKPAVDAISNFTDFYEYVKVDGANDTGYVSGDVINLTYTGATFNNKNVNSANKITITGLAIDNSNYELVTDSFAVNGKINPIEVTITADSFTGENALHYGDRDIEYTVQASGFLADEEEEEMAKVTYTSTYNPDVVGSREVRDDYKVTPAYTNEFGNYTVIVVDGDIEVKKAVVTVKPVPSKKLIYGIDVDMPEISATYTGWKYGEDSSVITAGTDALTDISYVDCAVTATNIATKLPDNYSMTYTDAAINGLEAENYEFVAIDGTLTIAKQEVSISGIVVEGKTYDGTKVVTADKLDLSNVKLVYYIDGTKTDEYPTAEQIAERFDISAAYTDKNVGTKTVTITLTLKGEFATKYVIKTVTDDDGVASQKNTTATITPAPLAITAKSRTIYFGEPLTFDPTKPGNYVTGDGFVNGESYSDLYGTLTYGAYTTDGEHRLYKVGSPAGSYQLEIGGFDATSLGKVQNYNITFKNELAIVLKIDPATLDTPEPIWNSEKPGWVEWPAVPGIGDKEGHGIDDNYVEVKEYVIGLYKYNSETDTYTLVAGSTETIPFEEGVENYEFDYSALVRQAVGEYAVKVTAYASLENNAGYCNVLEKSEVGTTEYKLHTTNVSVVFNTADTTTDAGKGDTFVIGPALSSSSFIMIEGEKNVPIMATLANATGYTVKTVAGSFVDDTASATNPVGISVAAGSVSGDVYTSNISLAWGITSTSDRQVVMTLDSVAATLQVSMVLSRDNAPYLYVTSLAPQFTVTANVVNDNVDVTGYKYIYQWYTKDSPNGTYVAVGSPIESTSNTNTYTLPLGKTVARQYYYAYCEVKAIRLDNGNNITKNTPKNDKTLAATIVKANIEDSTIVGDGWTYGETRTDFGVSQNPELSNVTYYYSDSENGTYTTTKPINVGNYYVYAVIDASDNFEEFTTPKMAFSIDRAKLLPTDSITMNPSPTAPYGLIKWETVTGPKENAGAADSDLTIKVNYHLWFYYETSEGDEYLMDVITDKLEYNVTDYVTKAGTYKIVVRSVVANTGAEEEKAIINCADSDDKVRESVINIATGIECDAAGYSKVYDGTPMTLTINYTIDGMDNMKYQWLKNNEIISGATSNEYSITYVDENATYICRISPSGNDDDFVYSTPAVAKILPRQVEITSADGTKIYDGTPLMWSDAKFADDKNYHVESFSGNRGIVDTDVIFALTQAASVTSAATGKNTASNTMSGVVITDQYGNVVYDESQKDVEGNTNNYIVTLTPGTLTVTKRAITVTAASPSHIYNGSALSSSLYTKVLTNPSDFAEGTDALASGDVITVAISGSRTNVGTTTNKIDSITIKNASSEDVTDCYTITPVNGTITVTQRDITDDFEISFDTDAYSEVYDGGYHTPEYTVSNGTTTLVVTTDFTYEFTNNVNVGTATLTVTGTGNYEGTVSKTFEITARPVVLTWTKDTFTFDNSEKTITASVSNLVTNVLTGVKDVVTVGSYSNNKKTLANSYTAEALTITGTDVGNYTIVDGSNLTKGWTIGKAAGHIEITTTKAELDKTYNSVAITPVSWTRYGTGAVTVTYFKVVNGTYTAIENLPTDAGTYAVLAKVAEDDNYFAAASADSEEDYLTFVIAPEAIKLTAKPSSSTYGDASLGTLEYEKTAGTYYEAAPLGTITVVTKTVKPATSTVSGSIAKTYTKDITVTYTENPNYIVTVVDADYTVNPRPLKVLANSQSREFNNTALTNKGYTLTESTTLGLADSITTVNNTSTITNVGTVDNVITSVVIKNSSDVDVTSSYSIEYEKGTLEITVRSLGNGSSYTNGITVADIADIVYNGSANEPSLTITDNFGIADNENSLTLVKDRDYTVAYTNNINQGTATITITGIGNYEDAILKTFVITKRLVKITANSNHKPYDGTALTDAGYTDAGYTGNADSGLVSGHVATVVVTGSQTEYGSSTNAITSVVIKLGETDVTDNYEIEAVNGTLSVDKINDNIQVSISDKTYDGVAITVPTPTGYASDNDGTVEVKFYNADKNELTGAPINAGSYFVKAFITGATNYNDAESAYVAFTIKQRKVKITANSNSKPYDGSAITDAGFETAGYEENADSGLVTGHTATVAITGSQTEYGTSTNAITDFTIMSGNVDVTSNYEIEPVNGKLSITKATDSINVAITDKVYDANAIDIDSTSGNAGNGEITVKYYDADKHELSGAPVNAGNYFVKAFIEESLNYQAASSEFVAFTIAKRLVKITANSNSKDYDGTALTDNGYSVEGYEGNADSNLVSGHEVTVVVEGSQTDYGKSVNAVTSVVIKSGETEVTDNYEIEKVGGELTINKIDDTINVTISNKTYDAVAITVPTPTDFAGNGTVEVKFYNSDKNELDYVPVNAGNYYVKAFITNSLNYNDASTEFVSFTIERRKVKITANSKHKPYDGTALTDNGFTVEGYDGNADSGLVSGHVATVVVEGSQTDYGSSTNAITSVVIKSGETTVTDNYDIEPINGTLSVDIIDDNIQVSISDKTYDGVAITVPTPTGYASDNDGTVEVKFYDADKHELSGAPVNAGNYFVKAFISGATNYNDAESNYVAFTIAKRPVKITANSNSKPYDGSAITDAGFETAGYENIEDSGLVTGHTATVAITGSQTDFGSSTNAITDIKIMSGDVDVTSNYEIEPVNGELSITKATDSINVAITDKVYDANAIDIDSTSGNTGNGEITVKYYDADKHELSGAPVNAGSYFVKAFIAESLNYQAASSEFVAFTIAKRPVKITANSNSKDYDGTALTDNGYSVEGYEGNADSNLVGGHEVTVVVEGSQTDYGKSVNAVTSVVIKSGETDVTDNYEIEAVDGELSINKIDDTINVTISDKTYDAVAITVPTPTDFAGNGTVEVKFYDEDKNEITTPVNAGSYFVKAFITGSLNYNDAASDYVAFTIAKRQVKITANSNSKPYDGTALTDATYVVEGYEGNDDSDLVSGHSVTVVVEGSQTNFGTSTNVITSIAIKAGEEDVTENYEIEPIDGTLTITKADEVITLTINDKTYDATAIEVESVTAKGDGEIVIKFYDSDKNELNSAPVNAGSYYVKASITGSLNYEDGQTDYIAFTINKAADNISLTINDKTYDGNAITAPTLSYLGDGVVTVKYYDAEKNELDVAPVNAGNYFVKAFIADSSNYNDDETDYVSFVINPRTVTIIANSDTKPYDGTPLNNDGYTIDGLVEGHVETVVITGSQTDYGKSDNVVTSVVIMDGDNDVTANYDIQTTNGELEITKTSDAISLTINDKTYDAQSIEAPIVTALGDGEVTIKYYDSNKNELSGAPVNVGTYFVKAFIADSLNYNDAETDFVEFTISKRSVEVTAASNSRPYNGEALTDNNYDITGLVTGHTEEVTITGTQTDYGSSVNAVTTVIIKSGETDVTDNYDITVVDGTLTITKTEDALNLTITDKIYDATAITIDTVTKLGDGTVTIKFYDSNKDELSTAPVNAGSYFVKAFITDSLNYNDDETGYIAFTIAKRQAKITADSASKVFDGESLSKDTYTVEGLVEGHVETVVITGTITEVGKTDNVVSEVTIKSGDADVTANYDLTMISGELEVTKAATDIKIEIEDKIYDTDAIVEKFVDVAGDGEVSIIYYDSDKNILPGAPVYVGEYYIKVVVTGSSNYQDTATDYIPFKIEKKPIAVVAASDEKVYDGTPLSNANYTVDGILPGHTAVVTVAGSQTNAGNSANTVASVVIMEEDIDITVNYDITLVEGTLNVTKADDTIVAFVTDKIYDGKVIEVSANANGDGVIKYTFYDKDGNQLFVAPENAGDYLVKASITGSTNYNDAESEKTAFSIAKRQIKITVTDATKVYDGEPLTSTEYTVSGTEIAESGLVEGQEVIVVIEGSQTDVGSSANEVVSVVISKVAPVSLLAEADETTDNYDIIIEAGVLTVTKAVEEITLIISDKTYDGEEIDAPVVTTKGDGNIVITYYVKDEDGEYSVVETPVNAGTYYVTATIADSLNYEDGTTDYVEFVINKKAITITSADGTKPYDGTPLAVLEFNYDGLLEGHEIIVEFSGSQTEVGTSENVIESVVIKAGDNDVTDNYEITIVNGTLEVTTSRGGAETGDMTNINWFVLMFLLSGVALTTELVNSKKRRKEQ